MKKSRGAKVAGFLALIAISVFFGIDIASSGLERVQGPPPSARATEASEAAAPPSASTSAAEPKSATPAPSPEAEAPAGPASVAAAAPAFAEPGQHTGAINRVSLALGDGLRYLAQGAIRFLADLIGAVLH
ncbi:hypothetical protein FE782_05585 [Paenibacillus antri]|uniref:Translation initiation factor 2 n=1 Tax=Paenibacillus antri TaxID=2582848 RepID=A0A5R9GF04_9BACL|nr:hypothetical protein [Paenibacillus antri]TLS53739.1 hypothetical protein FE782_05585 [Paenibacillus antri]